MKTPPEVLVAAALFAAALLTPTATARVVGRLHVNGPATNATAKIEVTGGPIIYIDPAVLPATTPADADFILITHNHGDHQELASINRIRKPGTVIYSSPPGVPTLTNALPGVTIQAVTPGQKFTLGGIEVETVPMYNVVRNNHPRAMNFVGYVVNVGGVRVYAAGDTERFPEMRTFTADIALLPLGQTFTMTSVQSAADAALDLRARIAIPYHYGRGEGTLADAGTFASLLNGRMQVLPNTGADGFAIEVSETIAIAEHPASLTVAPGSNAMLGIQASGVGTLRYQWRRNGLLLAGATASSLPITSASPANAGDYEVIVSDANGPVVSRMARVTVDEPRPGRLVNLSVRAATRAGSPLIVGAVTSGGARQVLVRGIGPALAAFGVGDTMTDPRLQIHAQVNGRDSVVASNDDWGGPAAGGTPGGPVGATALRATFAAVGAFNIADANSRDAAIVTTIESGRTIHVSDASNRPGVALVEIYDADPGTVGRLANLSARNFTGTGDSTLIAGFVISGNVPKRLLIRGVGPRLASGFGITDALADPKLELFLVDGGRTVPFAANDNWSESGAGPTRAAFVTTGAFDLPDTTSKDAALVVTAPAGVYTAQVSGVASSTGDALIEIYELP
jgi:L-ascorbate metabolism protein UlaG (beta-lactamase superfamily)